MKENYRLGVILSGWIMLLGFFFGAYDMILNRNYYVYTIWIKTAYILTIIGFIGIAYFDYKYKKAQ